MTIYTDPDFEEFTGHLLSKFWPLLDDGYQTTLLAAVRGFMLSRLRSPAFLHIGQVEAAYPHLYEFLRNASQEGPVVSFKMGDSLYCGCGGKYDHLDQQGDDDGVLDTYQCDSCSTFCLITWDPETERETKRVYTTAEGSPL
jgi:hypothetical protein